MPPQWLKHTPLTRLAHLTRLVWHQIRRPVTLGARAIIVDAGGRVLLIRHSYVGGWHLPGGAVDRGESLSEAARREVAEETGLIVGQVVRLQGIYARFRYGASDHVAVFVARDWRGAVAIDGVEIIEADFFPLDTLPVETSPATRRRLEEYLGRQPVAEHW